MTIRELHHIIPEVSKTTIHEAVTEKLGYRKVMTWFKGLAADFYDSGIYRSWFQDLINVWTMPATVFKNKVMYRNFVHSVTFVN